MRNPSPVQAKGLFWLPSNPEEKLAGELHISQFGKVRLDLLGVFSNPEWQGSGDIEEMLGHLRRVDCICGNVHGEGFVTLLNCSSTRINANLFSSQALEASSFGAAIALIGACYGKNELAFSSLNFTLEGLDDWLNTDTIKPTLKVKTEGDIIRSFVGGSVAFGFKESATFALNDDIEIQFLSPVELSPIFPNRPLNYLSLQSQPYISVISQIPRQIKYFIDLSDKIRKFISLAVDQEVQMQSFTFVEERSGQVVPIRMYLETGASRKAQYEPDLLKVLFTLSDIENDFAEMMCHWIERFEPRKVGHALNLYFAGKWKETSFLDVNFIFLAQAIEVLHRQTFPSSKPMEKKKYRKIADEFIDSFPETIPDLIKNNIYQANRASLRDRVEEMALPFENWFRDNETSKEFAMKVSETRNHLTHYSRELKNGLGKGEPLHKLYTKLEILLLLHILEFIGFNREQITTMTERSERLYEALDTSS